MSTTLDKDFYKIIPGYLRNEMEKNIQRFGNEDWFEEAWNEYKYLLQSSVGHFPSPNLYFEQKRNEAHYKKYFIPTIDEQKKMEVGKDGSTK